LAMRLLDQPSAPLSDIARQLGYATPFAFSRAFKSWHGASPETYRRARSGAMPRRGKANLGQALTTHSQLKQSRTGTDHP
jgi:AraC-like DNA-binding protein